MKITFSVDGELVRQGLEDVHAEIPKIGRRRIRTIMNRVVRIMQAYPARRPGQKYVRTGNLFHHWEIRENKQDSRSTGYTIENRARGKAPRRTEYAGYVVGNAYGTGQAWMHRNRWPVLRDELDEEVKKMPADIAKDIVMVARREGFDAKVVS